VLCSVLLKLYRALLTLQHVPQRWSTAEIVVLRKPNKPDYLQAKGVPTCIVARDNQQRTRGSGRESYLAETHRLLPENGFGGQPNRSAEQKSDG
jgi:hypothetical protein